MRSSILARLERLEKKLNALMPKLTYVSVVRTCPNNGTYLDPIPNRPFMVVSAFKDVSAWEAANLSIRKSLMEAVPQANPETRN